MKHLFNIAVMAAIFSSSLAAQDIVSANPVEITAVQPDNPSFEDSEDIGIGEDRNERMTVNVDIAPNNPNARDKGPFKFIIDTAAQRTVLSTELADNLELELEKQLNITTLSGTSLIRTVYVPQLILGNQETNAIIAPTFGRAALGADGILGLDSLQGRRVLFDFKTDTISLTKQVEDFSEGGGREIIVRARRRDGQLIFTNATIDDLKVNVIIDTGSESSIGNLALQKRLNLRKNRLMPTKLIDVRGKEIPAQFTAINDLRIGRARFSSLPIAFADIATFDVLRLRNQPAIFLGMDALRTFDRFAIDFEDRRIFFLLPEKQGLGR